MANEVEEKTWKKDFILSGGNSNNVKPSSLTSSFRHMTSIIKCILKGFQPNKT